MSKITKTLLVTAKEDLLKVIDKMDGLLGNIRNEIITNQQLIESNSVATKQELYIESEKIKKNQTETEDDDITIDLGEIQTFGGQNDFYPIYKTYFTKIIDYSNDNEKIN